MALHSIQLPESLFRRLQQQARGEQRSVDEWIQQTLTRNLPVLVELEDDMPPTLRSELDAMSNFSDAALWVLAKGTLSAELLSEWDALGADSERRKLTPDEAERQAMLSREYDEMLLRRAHAAMLLQSRGHDLSDPTILAA